MPDLVLAVRWHSGELGASSGTHPYPTTYDNNESISDADIVQWYWGKRNYTRPSGCLDSGSGCTTAYPLSFTADPAGY